MKTFINPGDKFGRLTAIRYEKTGKHSRRYFLFRCDCGNEITITAEAAISGNTKSCGCLRRDIAIKKYGLAPGQAAMRQVILQYKRHSNNRNHLWELSEQEFFELSQKDCFYCGNEPSQVKKSDNNTGDFIYNGIDRIDSSAGYKNGNVVPCCKTCNMAKNKTHQKDFLLWVRRVYEHTK